MVESSLYGRLDKRIINKDGRSIFLVLMPIRDVKSHKKPVPLMIGKGLITSGLLTNLRGGAE